MAVFFATSPLASRTDLTRFNTSAQAAVALFATIGSQPFSAVSVNCGSPLELTEISCSHFMRSLRLSKRGYMRVVLNPTGNM